MVADASDALRRNWLWAEFTALYIGAPVIMALFVPPSMLFPALFAFTAAGLALLWQTGGFDWRSLFRGWSRIDWRFFCVFAAGVWLVGFLIMTLTQPDYSRPLTPERLRFLTMIWVLYPLLSALPQELVFRPLFFHRFGGLFPNKRTAILINGAIFCLAHLMYWNPIVAVMTFVGGMVFARAYLKEGFPSAWLLHAIAGNLLFAVGMGVYFYSGNAVRPF